MLIIHCGDSYTLGLGCDSIFDSYASLVNQYYKVPLFNLAKNGASHYAIYLQIEYAITLRPSVVIINTTTIDRVDWLDENQEDFNEDPINFTKELSIFDINYHGYEVPYLDNKYPTNHILADIVNNPKYEPKIFSEPIPQLSHHIKAGNALRLQNEPRAKLQHVVNAYTSIVVPQIKQTFDVGLLALAIRQLEAANIEYLILGNHYTSPTLSPLLPEKNLLDINLQRMSIRMPDDKGMKHLSKEGHIQVKDAIVEHLEAHNMVLPNKSRQT